MPSYYAPSSSAYGYSSTPATTVVTIPGSAIPTTYSAPSLNMPTYYVPSSSGHHRSHSQSRSYSQQPQVYYTYGNNGYKYPTSASGGAYAIPQSASYGSNAYYPDGYSRSRRHSHSGYHATPSSSRSYGSSSGHRRSHSHSRHSTPQVIDYRNQPNVYTVPSGGYYNTSSHRRYSGSAEPSFGDRFRRMFGMQPSSSRNAYYVDSRGRTVDWQGRPIYRV